jgi:hypothetical protein
MGQNAISGARQSLPLNASLILHKVLDKLNTCHFLVTTELFQKIKNSGSKSLPEHLVSACRIPGGFCQCKLLQITAKYIACISMQLLPLAKAAYLALLS